MADEGMAKTERPKSRLPDGRVNPEYTAWRKANILEKPKPEVSPSRADAAQAALIATVAPSGALTLKCVKLARNKRFVLCEDPEQKGKCVPVRILPRQRPEKLLKKPVNVEKSGNGTYQQIR